MNTESNQDEGFAAELDSKITGELVGLGAVEIFGALTASIPGLGGIGTTVLAAWQAEQQRKFSVVVKHLFETIDDKKLDKNMLESDEFKELIIKIFEEASKTGSERKHFALAGALVNTCAPAGRQVGGKLSLLGILASTSDDELAVLEAIQDGRGGFGEYEHAIAEKLQWDSDRVKIACQGLVDQSLISSDTKFGDWVITSRGGRLMEWCTGFEQLGSLGSLKTDLKQEIASSVARDVVDALTEAIKQAGYH